jgi:hypothetical protein
MAGEPVFEPDYKRIREGKFTGRRYFVYWEFPEYGVEPAYIAESRFYFVAEAWRFYAELKILKRDAFTELRRAECGQASIITAYREKKKKQ